MSKLLFWFCKPFVRLSYNLSQKYGYKGELTIAKPVQPVGFKKPASFLEMKREDVSEIRHKIFQKVAGGVTGLAVEQDEHLQISALLDIIEEFILADKENEITEYENLLPKNHRQRQAYIRWKSRLQFLRSKINHMKRYEEGVEDTRAELEKKKTELLKLFP
jgi:hypothetical protein